MKKYSIGQFAKEISVTIQTLRNWDKTDKFKPSHVSPTGHRYYSQQQLDMYLGLYEQRGERVTVGYCRVTSPEQKDDLERQVRHMKTYLLQQGKPFEIITDIGSGINYNNKGLNKLIDKVLLYQVDTVVIMYKDRLLRFGYELLENLFSKYGTTIQVVDNTPKTEDRELVEDLIQVITVFSCNLQGERAHKAKRMIKELSEDYSFEKNQTPTNT